MVNRKYCSVLRPHGVSLTASGRFILTIHGIRQIDEATHFTIRPQIFWYPVPNFRLDNCWYSLFPVVARRDRPQTLKTQERPRTEMEAQTQMTVTIHGPLVWHVKQAIKSVAIMA